MQVYSTFTRIGWSPDFLAAHLQPTELEDDSISYWVQMYAKNWFETLSSPKSRFSTRLKKIGMLPSEVRAAAKVVGPLKESYMHEQLLNILIDYLLGDIPSFQNFAVGTWLHALPTTNEWHTIEDRARMMNMVCSTRPPKALPSSAVLFHVTSWTFAMDIMRDGIDIFRNRYCTDFGKRPAFYLNPSWAHAAEFAKKKRHIWNGQAAVLVYEHPKIPKKWRQTHFDSANEEWARLVTKSRKCIKNALDECDFVEGPMANNPTDIKNGKLPTTHVPAKFQWAAKTERVARLLDAHLYGVVWFAIH